MVPCAMLSLHLERSTTKEPSCENVRSPRDDASDGTEAQPKPTERETVKEIVMEVLSSLREAGPSRVPTDGATSSKETEKRGKSMGADKLFLLVKNLTL